MPRGERSDPWVELAEDGLRDRNRRARLTGSAYGSKRGVHVGEADRKILERRAQARREMASVIEWLRSEYVPGGG